MRSAFAVIVDFMTLVGLACVVGSGAVMRWVLMPGSEGLALPIGKRFQVKLEGATLLGWDRATWTEIHFWLAAAFVVILVSHLLVSWSKSGK